ncbi:hypothetical protein GUJ93_ZPchr0003g17716 [Zizania palustris]|uniref:Uncharacterized protein n=1 Tax=Zizania palustris TaxID=103762 RepID=A0A8J5VLP7_ZIZPA|nr:hypothetical protein GUJ93_ZPchr0003g17716 [Zizania palustris]
MLPSHCRLLPSHHRIWPHGLSYCRNWPPSPFPLPVLGRLGTAVNAKAAVDPPRRPGRPAGRRRAPRGAGVAPSA